MNALWKALALVCQDSALRTELQGICAVSPTTISKIVDDCDPVRRNRMMMQGTSPALASLHRIFNQDKKMRMSIYCLSELNRWLTTKANQMAALAAIWPAVGAAADDPKNPSDAFLEAAGCLLYDQELRAAVLADPTGQAMLQQGFLMSPAESAALRTAMADENVRSAADEFFVAAWTGGSCQARFLTYADYYSTNT